jgi:hypothetical protein
MMKSILDNRVVYDGRVIVKATCIHCGRVYWATEAFVCAVQDGREESLCGYCDGSHDVDGDDR